MNFLSIDCSMYEGSLFIKTQNKTFKKVLQSDKSNIDLLMNHILDFFKENLVKFEDLSYIFVNQGPGNFSGLRGSLATAKGISISKNLHLFGYNTLLWSCTKFFNQQNSIFSFIKFREIYFVQEFDISLKKISELRKIDKSEIMKKFSNKFKVVPKNMVKFFDDEILKLNNLNIIDLDHNELEFLKLKGLLEKNLIKPLYLS
jgi:tRNA threonylcarbamoyladenosine biosynthesis protein TsaB